MPLELQSEMLEQSYRENVETLERLHSSQVFNNGMPIHAAIIFESFFRHSEKSVKVFCKSLAQKVFGEPWLLDAAQKAVKRGVSLSVLVKGIPEESPFLSWLRKNEGHPGIVFASNVGERVGPGKVYNFATMDGRAYRFEPDEKKIEAYACMNDRQTATLLNQCYANMATA